jgi:hypothetical protein
MRLRTEGAECISCRFPGSSSLKTTFLGASPSRTNCGGDPAGEQ